MSYKCSINPIINPNPIKALCNEELCDLYTLPSIVKIVKLWGYRVVGMTLGWGPREGTQNFCK
jgi:hypothetical protein